MARRGDRSLGILSTGATLVLMARHGERSPGVLRVRLIVKAGDRPLADDSTEGGLVTLLLWAGDALIRPAAAGGQKLDGARHEVSTVNLVFEADSSSIIGLAFVSSVLFKLCWVSIACSISICISLSFSSHLALHFSCHLASWAF